MTPASITWLVLGVGALASACGDDASTSTSKDTTVVDATSADADGTGSRPDATSDATPDAKADVTSTSDASDATESDTATELVGRPMVGPTLLTGARGHVQVAWFSSSSRRLQWWAIEP